MSATKELELNFSTALLSGGLAGLSVDVTLFPLDTIKTRLQSAQGFIKAGGFHRIYSGLGSAAAGSMPTAAVFFCTYETTKTVSARYLPANLLVVGHMAAASFGEVMACLVRVPVEVVKQRAQTSHQASLHVLRATLYSEGFRGLYRGYLSTAIREVPFSFIQFPVWEFLKSSWTEQQGYAVYPWQSSICGALAGGFAAGLTTPLDVAKTRIMLANKDSFLAHARIDQVILHVFREKGLKGLFAGILPRVTWIAVGGAIFLGVYDLVKTNLDAL